jgi:hypothetical protein
MAFTGKAADASAELVRVLNSITPDVRQAIVAQSGKERALSAIDREMADLYASAEDVRPHEVADLRDPIKYAAVGILLMRQARSPRSKEKMFMHLGKVFGHDSKNINIDDKRSFKDVLSALQSEFKKAVPVQVVVKDANGH